METMEIFLWGIFGGFGAEVAGFFAIRHQNPHDFPYWIRSWLYYLIAGIMVLVGGGIALAYARSGTQMSAILAIQIGASAPLILRKLRDVATEIPPPPDPNRVD